MSKEIKDYLHLYLGCECLANVPNIEVKQWLIIDGDFIGYKGKNYFTNIQPILRKLSDMTEEEMNECGNLIYDFSDDEELNRWKWSDFDFGCAEQFHYLLSKHFDLFNLIPEGLAIDKTTFKNNG